MNKLLNIINKFYKLCLAKQQPLILYHGTAGRHLSSILSQGLIVDSTDKVWAEDINSSFYFPSRVSVGGVYLTKNLMTAITSSSNSVKDKKNEKRLIIIVKVMPGSIAADEDLLPSSINRILYNGSGDESFNCYLWSDLYNNQDISESRKNYIDLNLKRITDESPGLHVNLLNRLSELLYDGFNIALARNVSYVQPEYYKEYCLRNFKNIPPQPEKSIAEKNYSKYLDKLTKVLKQISIDKIKNSESGIKSTRVDSNIRFSGSNKILLIIELSRLKELDYDAKIIYASSDEKTYEALEDFKKQYLYFSGKDFKTN